VFEEGVGPVPVHIERAGDSGVSVVNTPSDGVQRPVANGLFIYTNESTPGAASKVVVVDFRADLSSYDVMIAAAGQQEVCHG